jgi:hypothetical protein
MFKNLLKNSDASDWTVDETNSTRKTVMRNGKSSTKKTRHIAATTTNNTYRQYRTFIPTLKTKKKNQIIQQSTTL